jgi:hypothetical protein
VLLKGFTKNSRDISNNSSNRPSNRMKQNENIARVLKGQAGV